MALKSDIEIAQEARPLPITAIAEACGVDEAYLEQYGRYKAKIDNRFLKETARPDGRLVLVTAITPTPAGEGKTTTTVGLADGLRKIGKNAVVALREPSLGPVFGIKGGAAGGGYAQVIPMEDINLHFTGDFHAIGAANNLLAAMLDNHIQQGNALGIDPKQITWRRCVDMNDRQLRNVVDGVLSLRNVRHVPIYIMYSLGIWASYFLHFYLTFYCFSYTSGLGITAALIAFVVGTFAVLVPTPNGAGPWHFAVKTILVLYGVCESDAVVFVLIVHTLQTLLVILLGLYAAGALGFTRRRCLAGGEDGTE